MGGWVKTSEGYREHSELSTTSKDPRIPQNATVPIGTHDTPHRSSRTRSTSETCLKREVHHRHNDGNMHHKHPPPGTRNSEPGCY
eukprot:1328296-Amorphochlora_amoeboformis.AAC.2